MNYLVIILIILILLILFSNSEPCPGQTSINNVGGMATSFCKCPNKQVFVNGNCKSCNDLTTYINGICVQCPIGATSIPSSVNTNITGCYCLDSQQFINDRCI